MKYFVLLIALLLTLTLGACDSVSPESEPALVQAPSSNVNAACAALTGSARGLCNSFYATGCDEDDSQPACAQITANYESTVGEAPPWCLSNSIGMAFTRIEAGTFAMGSTAPFWPNETPVHEVTITRDFCLGTYEVTQAQWVAVMGSNPSTLWPSTGCGDGESDDCPVEYVSWFDVIAFANQLSADEGLEVCYDADGTVIGGGGNIYACAGYRLPTEAEWEYAARAGTTTDYSWGEDYPPSSLVDSYAWYPLNGFGLHPVGQLLPNPWGLYDVHGNVYEWVHDWYAEDYYSTSPSTDPIGPAEEEASTGPGFPPSRVRRGGASIFSNPSGLQLRSGDRNYDAPDYWDPAGFGFRLLRSGS